MALRSFNNGPSATVSSSAFSCTYADIQSALGGANPIGAAEYRGLGDPGGYGAAIPSSGTLAIQRDFHARNRPIRSTISGMGIINVSPTQRLIYPILSSNGNYGDLLFASAPGQNPPYDRFNNAWTSNQFSFIVSPGQFYTVFAMRRNYIVGSDNYGYVRSSAWWRFVF